MDIRKGMKMDDLYWDEEEKKPLTFEEIKQLVEKFFKVTKAFMI